ncbi:MAG: 16S rRNA (adenine(1518)-N(6)/adenine(1519)-N(6))-dimethyltransferase RsmA, partial [archaeon]|nr:16S rRNA (adenine(1518)-N(6)/adenine(1519)-N(6))-dimethyltransferase RsmA [archaeon]
MLLQELKKILKENNFFLSKSLDQHFLYADSILKREVEYAEINTEDKLLEIGPGIGTLTEKILEKTNNLTVIEIDSKFEPLLQKNVGEVIIGDALKVEWPECNKIISNVPYSISSPLVFKILEQPIELAVLCLQKEFANRMVAEPGTKNYSRLSVNCAVRADIEFLETISKGKFFPIPLVDSALVRLRPKNIHLP